MSNAIVRYALFIVLALLFQILILNNIQFSGYVNPYIYLMIIMLLPVDFPQWLLLIASFVTGFIIDVSSGSPGIHSAATVLMGFTRPYILRYMSPSDGYEQGSSPSMRVYGFRWFFFFSFWMVLIHHFPLFYLEVFRLDDFFRTLLRVAASTGFSLIFILLTEYYRSMR